MPARRRSRQKALQVLYLWDLRKLSAEQALREYEAELSQAEFEEDTGQDSQQFPPPDGFAPVLVLGTAAHCSELDLLIESHAKNWRLERMPLVDRNLLRMAIYEMKEEGTPYAVVINEALELARRYTEAEAIPFLNGVLDAVRRTLFPDSVEDTPAGGAVAGSSPAEPVP